MNKSLLNLISVILLGALLFAPVASASETWLWAVPQAKKPARHLVMTVTPSVETRNAERAFFNCAITSDFGYRGAQVTLAVRDEKGVVVSEGVLPLDINAGANNCSITLDATDLPLGSYEAEFSIAHTLVLSEPSHTFTLRHVRVDDLKARLASNGTRLETLVQALDADGRSFPYLRLKTAAAQDVLALARENETRGAWESLEAQLRYVEERLDAVHAGMVFSGVAGERTSEIGMPEIADVLIQDGAFYAGVRPVFLFGGALLSGDVEEIARLGRYQLNAATLTVGPDANPAVRNTTDALKSRLDTVFEAANTHNVGIAVQLNPAWVVQGATESAPALVAGTRADIASEGALAAWDDYLGQVAPALNGRERLLGVSLAQDPRFYFEGETVKSGFLDFIRSNYPDRLTLNRAWRSHLATLDDIELRSNNPYDTYQNHRSFQFDWLTYHQRLGNSYFDWSLEQARDVMSDVPFMVTLPASAFETGEAVYGIDREALAETMHVSGTSGMNGFDDPVYAMAYPLQSAYNTLLRSFAPEQPVFNLHSAWDFPTAGTSAATYRFVHSALWEGVMSGLSGATVPMDSLLFQTPEALEAFATAALDVNRFASVVLAFQNAPTDVAILFSQSSKVFDKGDPHLKSALHAFEGSSFGGYNVRFVSEKQCGEGALADAKILVIPDTPAVSDETFRAVSDYVEAGGTVARTGAPIPYNERGFSRDDLIRNTGKTVLVRGLNLPTEYLHAMDAASVLGSLPQIPRTVTPQGYPLEGVRSRFVEHEGEQYLYVINLRKEPAYCTLATPTRTGRDLIQGQDVSFPTTLEPLVPMLIKLNPVHLEMTVTASVSEEGS